MIKKIVKEDYKSFIDTIMWISKNSNKVGHWISIVVDNINKHFHNETLREDQKK